jgi:hypothetical protein
MNVQSTDRSTPCQSARSPRIDREPSQWDDAFYAFLGEKERRSGSLRTVQSYTRMLQHFFAGAGKTPDRITS